MLTQSALGRIKNFKSDTQTRNGPGNQDDCQVGPTCCQGDGRQDGYCQDNGGPKHLINSLDQSRYENLVHVLIQCAGKTEPSPPFPQGQRSSVLVSYRYATSRSCGRPRIDRFCKTYRRPGVSGWLLGIGALKFYLMAGKRGDLAHPMTYFFVNGQNVPARLET